MKEPVDHILRPSLPWRDAAAITECGYDASKVKTISRPEYLARVKDMGQQRTAILTCMTCSDTVRRWGTWEDDPRLAIGREIEWERGGPYRRGEGRGERLRDELTAIEKLVSAHRDEFDQSLREIEGRREWNQRKATLARPKPRDRGGL